MSKGGVNVNRDYEKKLVFPDTQKELLYYEALKKLERYQRIKKIDTQSTSEQITLAIGSRSNAEFASEIVETPMKISRLLNGATITIKKDLIAKITAFACPDGGYSFEKLIVAQGFVEQGPSGFREKRFVDVCRKTISDKLLQQGKTVKYVDLPSITRLGDFNILTDALTGVPQEWLFECMVLHDNPIYTPKLIDRIYRVMAELFCGESFGRVSLIVDSEEAFSTISNQMSKRRIPSEISIILIVDDEIIDEYVIPLTDGREAVSLFEKHRQDK